MFLMFNMSYVFAQSISTDGNNATDSSRWTGVLWRSGEDPIIAPIAFKSEAACKRLLAQMNDIAKNTIHIERHQKCQEILPDDAKWSGVLWRNGEEPIIAPIGFKNESECKQNLTHLNDIAKNTVHVDRSQKCQEILPQIRPNSQ